jgi:hypothetical protein
MSVVRYDPATENFHSGQIGGTGAASASVAMAAGTDYPGAVDANWFQSGVYTPDGSYMTVYSGASLAAHAAAIPAGKDIISVEVAMLAGSYADFGSTVAIANFVNNTQNVFTSRTYPNATPAWSHTVQDLYVAAADVPAFLASAHFDISQRVPSGGNNRLDYFSVYVAFTVGIVLSSTFNLAIGVNPTPQQTIAIECVI